MVKYSDYYNLFVKLFMQYLSVDKMSNVK